MAGLNGHSHAPPVRSFLLLQGPIGPLFWLLARRLRRAGHSVARVLFNGGDRLFWRGPGAIPFRGSLEQWPAFLDRLLGERAVTDLVLFGDCRPLHRAAIAVARGHGVAVHVLEEGYLRPHCLTLEREGVNGFSRLLRTPAWFLAQAHSTPPWRPPHPVPDSFVFRAVLDVAYNLATVLAQWRYPGYRTHKPWHPLAEYRAGARRFFLKPFQRWRSARDVRDILAGHRPWYVFPLQLEADSQIRLHSTARSLKPVIEQVIKSFGERAPAGSLLVLTEHPLDTGIVDLAAVARAAARAAGVPDRVKFLRHGSPENLLSRCRGVVTVNSTVGYAALKWQRPVKPLGLALYDMPGLTFQGPLDLFWRQAGAPDSRLFDAFRRVVAAHSQLNGGLHSTAALRRAANGVAARLGTSHRHAGPRPVAH